MVAVKQLAEDAVPDHESEDDCNTDIAALDESMNLAFFKNEKVATDSAVSHVRCAAQWPYVTACNT